MQCSNCTTELWGRPAFCPVCGAPTGPARQPQRHTPPPWATAPEPPAAPPPAPSPPFFNASDLLDPDVLGAIPQVSQPPVGADIFSTGPLAERSPAPEPPPGMINAADLFDPAVLADLTGAGEQRGSAPNHEEAPAPGGHPSFVKGPGAPPRFTLTTLPGSQPPPAPAYPFNDDLAASGPPAPPEPLTWGPPRGYRGVSDLPPRRPGRPSMPPEPPLIPYAPPAPAKRGAPSASPGRFSFGALGGFLSLLLVLVILGGAILFGVSRYVQLQALQPKPAQTTAAALPTVAPKPGYTIYTDRSLGFSLQYADSWQEQADRDKNDPQYRGDLFKAGEATGLEVGSSPQYSSMSPAQIDDYMVNHLFSPANVASVQTSAPASPTIHIADLDWTAEDANLTLMNGLALRLTCLAILHNGRGYIIFYFASQQAFSSDDSQYFEPMLLSFRFLNDS